MTHISQFSLLFGIILVIPPSYQICKSPHVFTVMPSTSKITLTILSRDSKAVLFRSRTQSRFSWSWILLMKQYCWDLEVKLGSRKWSVDAKKFFFALLKLKIEVSKINIHVEDIVFWSFYQRIKKTSSEIFQCKFAL